MAGSRKDRIRSQRRKLRIRRAFKSKSSLNVLRVAVFRSLKHIYAQIIDDIKGITVVSSSTAELKDLTGSKKDRARQVGIALAKQAQDHGITVARFDRGKNLYHGRVKELAEGLREGGIQI